MNGIDMAEYTFRNKTTQEEQTLTMSMNDLDGWLKANPDWEQILTKMNIGDPIRLGVTKPPSDFRKHVLGKIHRNNPGSTIGSQSSWDIN